MPQPVVSHRNWDRTRGVSQFHMGTFSVRAGELSFAEQLKMVTGYPYREELDRMDEGGLGNSEWVHTEFGRGGAKVPVAPGDRDRDHRPQLDEELVGAVEESCNQQYPGVPASTLHFDRQLGLVLDRAVEYFNRLDCRLVDVSGMDATVEQHIRQQAANGGVR